MKRNNIVDILLVVGFLVCIVLFYRMQARPTVGLVDMPRLLLESGLREKIETRMRAAEAELLEAARNRESEYMQQRQAFGEDPAMQAQRAELDSAFQRDLKQMQNVMTARRQAVNRVLRTHLQPLTIELAREKRLHTVLEVSANVLYTTRNADLTAALVPELKADTQAILDDIEKVIAEISVFE